MVQLILEVTPFLGCKAQLLFYLLQIFVLGQILHLASDNFKSFIIIILNVRHDVLSKLMVQIDLNTFIFCRLLGLTTLQVINLFWKTFIFSKECRIQLLFMIQFFLQLSYLILTWSFTCLKLQILQFESVELVFLLCNDFVSIHFLVRLYLEVHNFRWER